MILEKMCITCKEMKEIIYFPIRKSSKDGRRNECSDCRSKYLKKYNTKNKEKLKSKSKEYYRTHLKEAQEYYEKKKIEFLWNTAKFL